MVGTGISNRRRVILATFLVLGILAGCFVVKLLLFVSGKPAISVNYAAQYNECLKLVSLDPNDNAAPDYQEAFARLPDMPDDVRRIGGRLEKYEPNSAEWRIVVSWLTSSDEALQAVRQAATKPDFWVELSSINFLDSSQMEGLDFAKFQEALFGLNYKARYLILRGDVTGAFDCVVAMYRMARHMGKRGRIQINLGQVMEGLANRTMFDLLSKTDLDSGLLSEFQRQWGQIVSQRTPPSFDGDEILLRDAIQRYFTDNGEGDGHLVPRVLYDLPRGRSGSDFPNNELMANALYVKCVCIAWMHPSRQRTTHILTYLVESANQLVRKPPWELHDKNVDPADQLAGIVKGNHFLRTVSADVTLARTIQAYHEIDALYEALIATMAILRFDIEQGARPRSLEELATTGYLRRVPIDPYSGKPLVYKQAGDSFTLYSCGRDFDDDGGTPSVWGKLPDGGDQVFWPVEENKK